MSIFKDQILRWDGKAYTVPANKVMGLIEVVEDVITIAELNNEGGPKIAKISRAYVAALNYAGCKDIETDEVYTLLFGANDLDITQIVLSMLSLMIPPEHLQEKEPEKKPAKKRASRKKDSG